MPRIDRKLFTKKDRKNSAANKTTIGEKSIPPKNGRKFLKGPKTGSVILNKSCTKGL